MVDFTVLRGCVLGVCTLRCVAEKRGFGSSTNVYQKEGRISTGSFTSVTLVLRVHQGNSYQEVVVLGAVRLGVQLQGALSPRCGLLHRRGGSDSVGL